MTADGVKFQRQIPATVSSRQSSSSTERFIYRASLPLRPDVTLRTAPGPSRPSRVSGSTSPSSTSPRRVQGSRLREEEEEAGSPVGSTQRFANGGGAEGGVARPSAVEPEGRERCT